MTFYATYFGANGWFIEFEGINVLIDPWLRGKLTFPISKWLLEVYLPEDIYINKNIDLILLTQALSDHSHIETLDQLNKSIPILASEKAKEVAKSLNYKNIEIIKPGQNMEIENLSIRATAGAKVPHLENGYILSHPCGSIYIELHGFLDNELNKIEIDALLTPVTNVSLLNIYKIIKGKDVLPDLINRFNPKVILASALGGGIKYKGLLSGLIRTEDNGEEGYELSRENDIRIIYPYRCKRYNIS